jgi:hypothetical protein
MRLPLVLAKAFVVAEDEGSILDDRSAEGPTELVPPELGYLARGVEFISSVERGVAEKLINSTVQLIRASAGDRIDYSARGFAVVRGCVRSNDGELLNCVDAKVRANDATRSAVGVVIDTDTVDAIVILLRASASNGELIAQPSIGTLVADCNGRLSAYCGDTGLEGGELSPIATI